MTIEWKGVFPALTTKFDANDQLDLPAFEKNLYAQLEAGRLSSLRRGEQKA